MYPSAWACGQLQRSQSAWISSNGLRLETEQHYSYGLQRWVQPYSGSLPKTWDSAQPIRFHASTSQFGRREMLALRMKFDQVSFHDILGEPCTMDTLPETMKELVLEDVDQDDILTFHPKEYPSLNLNQNIFLKRLQQVVWNNQQP